MEAGSDGDDDEEDDNISVHSEQELDDDASPHDQVPLQARQRPYTRLGGSTEGSAADSDAEAKSGGTDDSDVGPYQDFSDRSSGDDERMPLPRTTSSGRRSKPPKPIFITATTSRPIIIETPPDPKTVKEAMSRDDWPKWKEAMDTEIKAFESRRTYKKVIPPPKAKPIGCKWIFKLKKSVDGQVRYRARLVAQGLTQRFEFDYTETFARVVRAETLRWLLSYAILNNYEIHMEDIVSAYLYADMDHVVYMKQIPGYDDHSGMILLLLKSLYGTKQAGHLWHVRLTAYLIQLGFVKSTANPCLLILITP